MNVDDLEAFIDEGIRNATRLQRRRRLCVSQRYRLSGVPGEVSERCTGFSGATLATSPALPAFDQASTMDGTITNRQ
jgi:hypothetical protein